METAALGQLCRDALLHSSTVEVRTAAGRLNMPLGRHPSSLQGQPDNKTR